jgi:acetyl esterase
MDMADLRLHPQAAKVLQIIKADPGASPKYNEGTPEQAREVAAARRVLLNIPPEPVDHFERREIPGPAGPVPIFIYRPAGAPKDARLPVFLHFHGGGFVVCSSETHDPQNRYWANHSSCIVVSVDYRLSPEAKFPAAVDDCYAATRWVAEHADEIGADGSRLAVGGESAGGNLAAVVAQLAAKDGPKILLQVLIVPVTDWRYESPAYKTYAEGYGLELVGLEWFRENYLNGEQDYDDPRAAPLRAASLAGLPPALVITAGFDPMRDDGRAYADRLALAGVPVEYFCYEGMPHPFIGWGGKAPLVLDYMDRVCNAVRRALVVEAEQRRAS